MDIPTENIEIQVADRKVVLNPNNLVFNEASLTKYIECEHVWYDHFGQALAELELEHQTLEIDYDALYGVKFKENKEAGASDKLADAYVKSDGEIVNLRKKMSEVKKNITLVKNHLRAWDKSHDNAQSRGHMLRKEMDKLNGTISMPKETHFSMEEKLNGH